MIKKTTIGVTVVVSAAHWLPNVPDGHKCKNLHGHNFTVWAEVTGEVDPSLGWIADYSDIRAALKSVVQVVDHNGPMNNIPGLENPTAEIFAAWIATRFAAKLPPGVKLCKVLVSEKDDTHAIVVWEDDHV